MRLRLNLASERVFWTLIGAGAVCVLVLLFVWALPAHKRSRAAVAEWQSAAGTAIVPRLGNLAQIEADAKATPPGVPSRESLADWEKYRKFLNAQAESVETTFARYTAAMESPLGPNNTSPVEVKNDYVSHKREEEMWLAGKMTLRGMSSPFKEYPWITTAANPAPDEFLDIKRDFYARRFLYRTLFANKVQVVERLIIDKAQLADAASLNRAALDPDFRIQTMSLQLIVLLPPEQVDKLITGLQQLVTMPSGESAPEMIGLPPLIMTRLEVTALRDRETGYGKLCRTRIDGQIVLFPPRTKGGGS